MKKIISVILAVLMLISVVPITSIAGSTYVENATVGRSGNTAIRWNYGTYTGYVNHGPYCDLPDGEGTLYFTNDIPGKVYTISMIEDLPDSPPYSDRDKKATKYVGGFSDGYSYGSGKRYYDGGYIMDGTFYGSYKNAYDNGGDRKLWEGKFWYPGNNKYIVGWSYVTSYETNSFVWQKYYYKINYNANGGSGAPSAQWKEQNTNLTLSTTNPTRDGYDFLGWSTNKNATSATYSSGGTYSANQETTLYAVWKAHEYRITYNANGGTGAPASQTKIHDVDLILSSEIPVKQNYQFVGWESSVLGHFSTTYQPGDIYKANASKTLNAIWAQSVFEVTYNANGGVGAPSKQTKGEGIDLTLSSTVPTREGYTFVGWAEKSAFSSGKETLAEEKSNSLMGANIYENQDAFKSDPKNTFATPSYQPGDLYTSDKDITLFAVWRGCYTITYDANGGNNAPSSQTFSGDGAIAISYNIPTRNNSTFKGWSENKNATDPTYLPGDAYTKAESVTLYAVWGYRTAQYTITYEANGGFGAPAVQFKDAGQTINISNQIPVKLGYQFIEWSNCKELFFKRTFQPGDTYSSDADLTIYAMWEKTSWGTSYNVKTYTMNTQGDYVLTNGRSYTADFEVATADFTVPEGFHLNTELSILTGLISYDQPLVLKIYLDRNVHTVSFNDGTNTTNNELYYGANIVRPAVPVKEGHTFLGWSEDGETIVNVERTMPDRDLNYTAVWGVNQYTVTYKLDGEEFFAEPYESAVDVFTYGDTVTVRETPELPCHTITEWTLTPELVDGKMPAENVVANATSTVTHTPDEAVEENRVEPTCEGSGSYDTVVYCSVCGEELSRVTTALDPTGHDWNSGEVTVLPTCTEDGVKTYTCNNDASHIYTETVPASGHNPGDEIVENRVEPTCEEAGSYDSVVYCTVCGEEVSRVTTEIDPIGHDWDEGEITTNPTCTEEGVRTYTCHNDSGHTYSETIQPMGHNYPDEGVEENRVEPTCEGKGSFDTVEYCTVCGEELTRVTTELDPIGHNWSDGEITTPATCTTDGVKTYTCKNDASHTYTETVSATGHTSVTDAAEEPTCTETGLTEGSHCSTCGEILVAQEVISATGHDWNDGEITTPATCATDGVKTYTCKNDASHTYTETISASGHTSVTDAAVEPTCTETGLTEGSHCSTCGEILVAQEIVSATGHDWNDGEITTPATCTTDGVKTYTCKNDASHTYTETVSASGHKPGEAVEENRNDATCEGRGSFDTVVYCSACGQELSRETTVLSPHGHDYHKIDSKCVAPDYGVEGYDYYECSYDSDHNYRMILPALVKNTYTVTFVADGEVVAVVPYTEGDKFVDEPAIPEKDNHTAEWSEYELNDNDITVEAVYTPIDLNNISDINTEKTIDSFEDGIATITLSAAAATRAVRFTTSTKKPVDVVMVLDLSGSMDEKLGNGVTETKMDALKSCAISFIDKVNKAGSDNRVALVGFASGEKVNGYNMTAYQNTGLLVTEDTGFVNYRNASNYYSKALISSGNIVEVNQKLSEAIEQITAGGSTNTQLGLLMAKNILAQNGADGREKVVVLITDGNPTTASSHADEIRSVAPLAITYANDIKNSGVKLYTVGVDASADENAPFDSTVDGITGTGRYDSINGTRKEEVTFDFNRFLNIISTNYPDAKAMNNYGIRKNAGYYMSVRDTSKLDEIFSKIIYSSVDRPVAFTKCSIVDTLSSDFTLTLEQEYALREKLVREYSIPDSNISISRNNDGTTTIRIDGVPAVKKEVDGKTIYVASVTFDASLNKYEAGYYDTNTEDAFVEIGGEQISGFDIPESVNIPAERNIVVFKINGEVYRIEEGRLGDAVTAPSTALASWTIPADTVITGNYAEFEADAISTDVYTVIWDIDGENTTENYAFGSVINIPAVPDKEDLDFVGFSPAVPHIMPAKNMTFTAIYAPRHEHHFTQTGYYGTCTDGITIVSTCSCGETAEEKTESRAHSFSSVVVGDVEGNSLTDSLVCSVCGASENHTLTFKTKTSGSRTYLDLDMEKDGVKIQPAEGTSVKIMVPWTNQGYTNTNVKVYRVNEQGVVKYYDATVENGYLVFYADHFSVYVIEEDLTAEPISFAVARCELNGTHSYSESVTSPTCTAGGYTTHTCPSCGDSYVDSETAAAGHTPITLPGIPATCVNPGLTDGKICATCGSTITQQQTIPATGKHVDNNGDGKCDTCGASIGAQSNENLCKWCGKVHGSNFIQKFVAFFHRIFATIFGAKY